MPVSQLPIEELRQPLAAALRGSNRLILQAPTGSGKSTQIPQMLRDEKCVPDDQLILILQPRRLAARMLASRVAAERGASLGGEVGYHIRLDRKAGPQTRILFVTEGILLRQLLNDPRLSHVGAILFDEFHERHLYGDISLARALDLQEKLRPDLKIIVMSATLDNAALGPYLAPCETLSSEGRTFPVEIAYLPQSPGDEPVWELAARAIERELPKTTGHALVFMPGAYEISRTISELRGRLGGDAMILPLHGELPPSEQDRAVERGGPQRVIVSTNVAETSLTIDGVTLVVDAGLARIAKFDAQRGIDTLLIEKISRASADQRAGRAGRTAPGRALRLWTQYEHEKRPAQEIPEIRRLDLTEVVLNLKAADFGELREFRWLEPPDWKGLERAELLLHDLGALDTAGRITETGRQMLPFPVHPRYARLFLEAARRGCVRAAALIAAFTQTRGILMKADRRVEQEREELFGGGTSDFSVLMRAYQWAKRQDFRVDSCRRLAIHADAARQVGKLMQQFLAIAESEKLPLEESAPPDEEIARCVLAGFGDQVARRRSMGTLQCDLVHGRRGMLARSSIAQNSRLLVIAEITEIGRSAGEAEVTLNLATEIEEEWLKELFPADFKEGDDIVFDSAQNRVVQRLERSFRGLVLESRDRDVSPDDEVALSLAEGIEKHDLPLPGWDDAATQLIRRLNSLAQWMPELELPVFDDGVRRDILLSLCEDAVSYRDVKDRSAKPFLMNWLKPHRVALLDRHAPERVDLPSGRKAKIVYREPGGPTISAKIQELFGLKDSPKIANGRIPVTLEILAPSQRPVQTTQDLASFWSNAYPKLKAELQRRYPKHEWR